MPFPPFFCSILPPKKFNVPQHIMFDLAPGITNGWNAPCQLYVPVSIKIVWKCEKEVNEYIEPHSVVLRHNVSQQSMSSIPLFHFSSNVPFYPQHAVFRFTPSITLQYNAITLSLFVKSKEHENTQKSYIILFNNPLWFSNLLRQSIRRRNVSELVHQNARIWGNCVLCGI